MVDERALREKEEGPGYETSRVDLRIPLGTGAMAIILLSCGIAIVFLFYHFVWKSPAGTPAYPYTRAPQTTPAPRLLAHPKAELRALRTLNHERLNSYGWINKKKGIVHIPIQRAMQIIAKHGFPPRPPVPINKINKEAVPLAPTGEKSKPYKSGTANAAQSPPP
ncbi:MAG TPA: hypothetical protein VFK24_04085 [Gammaproteobacteria bacterium]|nr:hypothetical protein [Gammaproteobacteria bacterium]